MEMRIATWNIRGWGAEGKKNTVKNLIKEESIELIGLVETKHSEVSQWDMLKCWGKQDIDWVHIPASNSSGGLILMWQKEAFLAVNSFLGQRWICVQGVFTNDDFRSAVCVVYAPNDQRGRRSVWNQLRDLKHHLKLPLVLMGDFNEVISLEERKGAEQFTPSMRELGEFFQDLQLLDMEIGQKFTWVRRNAASRLDRILVTQEFVDKFQNIQVCCKSRMLSDHAPLVLFTTNITWGPCPFRSLDIWLEEPNFLKVFKKEWVQMASFSFVQKLKAIKRPLRKWNQEVFGHIDSKISTFQKELDSLDNKAECDELLEVEWLRREAIQTQLRLWLMRKERYWKQLSRCKLLKEGDKTLDTFISWQQ